MTEDDQSRIEDKTIQGDQNEVAEEYKTFHQDDKQEKEGLTPENVPQLLSYYSANHECGFSGGTFESARGGQLVKNSHHGGSGMSKVFKQVTIIRTGGGGMSMSKQERQKQRIQLANRRKSKAI